MTFTSNIHQNFSLRINTSEHNELPYRVLCHEYLFNAVLTETCLARRMRTSRKIAFGDSSTFRTKYYTNNPVSIKV